MRTSEKFLIVAAVIVCIPAIGSGIFDVYLMWFRKGVGEIMDLGEISTEALIALGALVTGIVTLLNSSRGRKKRK